MQTWMLGLEGMVRRHRRVVVALWLVALLAALPFAARQGENLTGGGFQVPGSQSEAVETALERDFAAAQRAQLAVVLVAREGADAAAYRAALARVARGAGEVGRVAVADAVLARASVAVRARDAPRAVVLPLDVGVGEADSSDVAVDLREELGIGSARGSEGPVSTHLIGQGALWAGLQHLSKEDLESAEVTGFPIVALILLGVFGSLAAAALPLALGFVSVIVTGAAIFLLSRSLDMSVFVTNMASMIGIGVAVDYSLFVLARYREEIRAGRSPDAARATALATSGVAVVFSGLTVIASLAGLLLIDTTALRSMALGAMLVVAVSVLASATLLPALIALLGHRASARGRAFTVAGLVARSWARRRPGSTRPDRPPRATFWERWTARVMRRPVVSLVAAGGLLLVLAIPALSLQTGDGALRQFPAGHEVRTGFEAAAAQGAPAGASTPVKAVVRFDAGTARDVRNAAALRELRATLAADPAVAAVAPAQSARDGRSALIAATPRADGESAETKALVERMRDALPAAAAPAAQVQLGGTTAGLDDFHDLVAGSMWKIVLFVMVLSYLVLLVLLRSAVLPLKAVAMNLLSVGVAYGVLVAVFQWGWLDGLFGFESPGYLDTITPPLVLAVVFGLSMDYEVFLLSRIKERYAATGDTRTAVAQGLATSARTITSAALIMVAVFAVFVFTGVPSIKQLGLGNAVAIAVDATLVRLVLVPAAMALLGRWNWWLPRPLERVLPRADFEELAPATG